jgi:hypothetical protein
LEIKRLCSKVDSELDGEDLKSTEKKKKVFLTFLPLENSKLYVIAQGAPRRIMTVTPEWIERQIFNIHSYVDA